MNPDEFSEAPPDESVLAPGMPPVEEILQHYRSRAHARRRRRRRLLLIVGSGLLGGAALMIAGLGVFPRGRDRHLVPPPEPAASTGSPTQASGPLAAPGSTAPAATKVSIPPRSPATSRESPPSTTVSVRLQPRERLAVVRAGDMKERVFDLFGGTVQRQDGALVRIDGMRLRAKGRSPDHPQMEVADVEVAENGRAQRYWFLFGEGTLMAWGRSDDWPATVKRYQVDISYR